jgi:uncharacterized protein YuzE
MPDSSLRDSRNTQSVIDYDARYDILFVGRPGVTTVEHEGYDLDLDADGRPCGIELARARELLMGATP